MTEPWYRNGTLHFGVGIEDTFVPQERAGERALDEYTLTEHYLQWHNDLFLAANAGASFVRWGVPWYRVQPEIDRWDWTWLDRVFARFAELGLRPIVDLMHYGTPLWLKRQFDDDDYPQRVAEYSVRIAERYADSVTDYTPVNEPMVHALFAGEYGYWPPYLNGEPGLARITKQIARGFALAQEAMQAVLGTTGTFVHVDAGMRYAGDLDAPDQRELAYRLQHQVWLVEDLVTGQVNARHPLERWLSRQGLTDDDLLWFAEHTVQPDVYGINYYPRHSTELLESGVHHRGGFADPRPVRDDGIAGLIELLQTAANRYQSPVMVSETCVTGTVEERLAWLDDSSTAVRALRESGLDVVGYTWWPLFDMYEWTWRHSTSPRDEHRLTMGLYELVEQRDRLSRQPTALVGAFRRHARHL